ncbi:hypothetical protein [Burkholderia plantarii]|uniref:hypothetical protein n=1 Tax=Burkholderia plantarii TaxID=41899 RepID=UPI001F5B8544|nr:hypothetical protein [Burkholderia plantarii]
MLELTGEQVAGLAEIDARGYVERIRQDLVESDPKLANDTTLPLRLFKAYRAAQRLGIRQEDNVAAFLRLEAYGPDFYERPATRAWLTKSGHPADERFHDYLRVMKWRIEHPNYDRGHQDGVSRDPADRGSSGGVWSRLAGRWRSAGGRDDSDG